MRKLLLALATGMVLLLIVQHFAAAVQDFHARSAAARIRS
jgi:hypothetical protein